MSTRTVRSWLRPAAPTAAARALAIMAAETLGMRPIVVDTASVGYAHLTGGSRATFATGMSVVETTMTIIQEPCVRAAKMWDVDPEGVA
jgi:NADPH-dependent 2,4-dienoyl-CoA reductase/sulfur reductase-like enzyme